MYLDLIKGYKVTIGGTMPLLKNIERTLIRSRLQELPRQSRGRHFQCTA